MLLALSLRVAGVGCTGAPAGDAQVDRAIPSDTASAPLIAACGWHDGNELRLACAVSLVDPAPIEVRFEVPGEGTRLRASDALAREHEVVLWDLPADTEVAWRVADRDGRLEAIEGVTRTGFPPARGDLQFVDLEPGPTAIERLLLAWSCGGSPFLVVVDGDGRVRWYHGLQAGTIKGIDVGEDGTFLGVIGRSGVLEVAPDGRVLQRFAPDGPGALPLPVHHDVVSRHGQTLALNARAVDGTDGVPYVSDGLYALSGNVATDVWHLAQVFDPTGLSEPPGYYWFAPGGVLGIDFGHANSIDVSAGGDWLLSFKHLDTVMAVSGHPGAANRGEILWEIVGGKRGAPVDPLDYTSIEGIDGAFEYPHHARWIDDDTITVFDNGRASGQASRVLEIDVDPGAGTARATRAWELEERCPIQSSGYRLEDGSMVAFCTATRTLTEFDPAGDVRRRSTVACINQDVLPMMSPRAIPFSTTAIAGFGPDVVAR